MLKIFLILIFINFSVADDEFWLSNGYQYSNNFCEPGEVHVTYQHTGELAESCVEGTKVLELSDKDRQLFVDATNEARNLTASGENEKLPKAARIGAVTWNSEMEHLAEISVKRCVGEHDQCRNTENLRYAGQNIYSFGTTEEIDLCEVIRKAIKKWSGEAKKVADLTMQSAVTGKGTGHFNQLVFEITRSIGCAIRTQPDGTFMKYTVYCNYDYGCITEKPVYKVSDIPGDECALGVDEKYSSLCKNEEPIPEDWMFLLK